MILVPHVASTFQEGLLKDASILQAAFRSMHPGLYRYNTHSQTDQRFARLRSDWSRCSDLKQAYVALSEFTATIRCGHTYPNFFNQDKRVARELFAGVDRVPFYFRWLNGKMVVLRDFTPNHSLPRGTEIDRIDGIPTSTILKRMIRVARADGGNRFKRLSYLSIFGEDTLEAFDIYLPMMFKIPAGKFNIHGYDLRGRARTVLADPVSSDDRAHRYRSSAPPEDGALWTFGIKNRIATLKMPSWEMYDTKWDWKTFLKTSFSDMRAKKISNLIVDLRGNEGGLTIGNDILPYLLEKPIQVSESHLYSRYLKLDDRFRPYVSSWANQDFDKLAAKPIFVPAAKNKLFPLPGLEDARGTHLEPNRLAFTGKLFVLVDSSNSSATFEFEKSVQDFKLGTLVGEPTGGNLRGINGGRFYFVKLPNSRLEVDLPLVGEFPVKPQPDRGLIPDVTIYPTRRDIAVGRDPVLRWVMRRTARAETR